MQSQENNILRIWTQVAMWLTALLFFFRPEVTYRRDKSRKPDIIPNAAESLEVGVECSTNELNL